MGCLPLFASAASYLPKPNDHAYQFVYVDSKGAVGSRSTPFTFGAPKPLEDLVTLEEGGQEDGAGEDMLMVIPRAELLQVSKSALCCKGTRSCPSLEQDAVISCCQQRHPLL